MRSKRLARLCALQILYPLELNKALQQNAQLGYDPIAIEQTVALFWAYLAPDGDVDRAMTKRLVHGVLQEQVKLDKALEEASQHWRLARMAVVDRIILRLGAYEILCCSDVPRAASMNEAIEIAKQFGTSQSASFVNGLLDRLGTRETHVHQCEETTSESRASQIGV